LADRDAKRPARSFGLKNSEGDAPKRTFQPVDVHVGRRIRAARLEARMSQEGLAAQLKVSFQQLQKYEKGANRVSPSRMMEIAHAVGKTSGWFFEDTGPGPVEAHRTALFLPIPEPPLGASTDGQVSRLSDSARQDEEH
jgi:transcriptional regulator with XRE-family HTH domain